MQCYRIEKTSDVPISVYDAVERHKDEAKYETVVLEMAMVDEDGIWFEKNN